MDRQPTGDPYREDALAAEMAGIDDDLIVAIDRIIQTREVGIGAHTIEKTRIIAERYKPALLRMTEKRRQDAVHATFKKVRERLGKKGEKILERHFIIKSGTNGEKLYII